MSGRKILLLEDVVKGLEDDITALKGVQRSGAGNIQGYAHMEPGDNDLFFVSNARIKKFLVTLTHTNPDEYQMVNISWAVSNTRSDPLNETGGVFVNQQCQQMPPEPGVTKWLVSFRNVSYPPEYTFGTTSYNTWVKFIFYGTTDISFSVAAA